MPQAALESLIMSLLVNLARTQDKHFTKAVFDEAKEPFLEARREASSVEELRRADDALKTLQRIQDNVSAHVRTIPLA